jgi:ATP-dependent DNA helicase RecQ
VQQRPSPALPVAPPGINSVQQRLSLADVDLSFAGRYTAQHKVHAAIAAAQPNDPLTLKHNGARWELLNAAGIVVGRLAQAFNLPAPLDAITLSVAAVLVRNIEDSDEAYQHQLACKRWEVIIPQLRW